MSILVVGSFMMDCVTRTPQAPQAGETITGISYKNYPGGKGANQAVAARRMGAEVIMAGMVGNDSYGETFINIMKNAGIDIKNIKKTNNASTGIGSITLEENGQNRIIIVPGANYEYSVADLMTLEDCIKEVDIVLTQLELREEITEKLAELCQLHKKIFILNPAPARSLSDKVLKAVSILTPNETELQLLTGMKLSSMKDYVKGARLLCNAGVKTVVVTLGDKGCLFVNLNKEIHLPGYKVPVVDTTGAGDSFTGSLAASIDSGLDIRKSIKIANAVGALTIQKNGAIPSLPDKDEVLAFMNLNSKV